MADSGALRVRRLRAHRAGDHSLCRIGVCPDLVAAVAEELPGAFARALETLVTGLELQPDDPRMVDIVLARSLAPAVDGGSIAAVKQVREILSKITMDRPPSQSDPPDSVDIAIARGRLRHEDIARRAAAGEFDRFGEELDHPPWRLGPWGEPAG